MLSSVIKIRREKPFLHQHSKCLKLMKLKLSPVQRQHMSLTNKVLVHIVGSRSHNSDFTEQREGDSVGSTHKAVDLLVAAGLLLPKLVAREGQNIKVVRPIVPLELLQVFVVFLSEATFTGYVHHQGHLKPQKYTVKTLQLQSYSHKTTTSSNWGGRQTAVSFPE